jgi:hypothetical protein
MNEQQSSGPAIRKCSPGVFSAEARRYANADDATFEKLRQLFAHNEKAWAADPECWGILKVARHSLLRSWRSTFGKVR